MTSPNDPRGQSTPDRETTAFAAPAPQGPPQGTPPAPQQQYAPPQQYDGQFGAPSHGGRPRPASANGIWTLGLLSLVAVVAGLSISENGANLWSAVHAWGALAILGSLFTLAPVAGSSLPRLRAWQASACGAGALVLFWVLFVLPRAGSNTSLVLTIGVAAGAVATWIAPGRDDAVSGETRDHSW